MTTKSQNWFFVACRADETQSAWVQSVLQHASGACIVCGYLIASDFHLLLETFQVFLLLDRILYVNMFDLLGMKQGLRKLDSNLLSSNIIIWLFLPRGGKFLVCATTITSNKISPNYCNLLLFRWYHLVMLSHAFWVRSFGETEPKSIVLYVQMWVFGFSSIFWIQSFCFYNRFTVVLITCA